MAVASRRHGARSPLHSVHGNSRSGDAPNIKNEMKERTNSRGAGGSSLTTGNLPAGTQNIDQRSRHSARSCRYGARCRGRNTYCIFAHPCSSSCNVDHVPSDWSVVSRRRSPRIRGAVVNDVVHDDAILDNLVDNVEIANRYGIFSEISATDASP